MCLSVSTFSFAHFGFAVWWNVWLKCVCSSRLALLKLIAFNNISCERLCESMTHALVAFCEFALVFVVHNFYLRELKFLGNSKKLTESELWAQWKWIILWSRQPTKHTCYFEIWTKKRIFEETQIVIKRCLKSFETFVCAFMFRVWLLNSQFNEIHSRIIVFCTASSSSSFFVYIDGYLDWIGWNKKAAEINYSGDINTLTDVIHLTLFLDLILYTALCFVLFCACSNCLGCDRSTCLLCCSNCVWPFSVPLSPFISVLSGNEIFCCHFG